MSLADDFKEFVNRPGLSPFTRDKYYYRLRPFVALHGDKNAEQVTTAMLADFIALQPNLADPSRAYYFDPDKAAADKAAAAALVGLVK